ncbi:Monoacylglycerol O-acyltransferase 3b [Balamuthia mandrillaris]
MAASWLSTVSAFVLFNLLYFVAPAAFLLLPVYAVFWTSYGWLVTLLLLPVYCFWTFDGSERKLGRPWRFFYDNPLLHPLFDYFPLELKRDGPELDPHQTYIFTVHPHGVVALNRAIFAFSKNLRWNKVFPGIETRDLVASTAFQLPIIREVWLWTNCVDASRPVALNVLRNGMSVLVYPGGEAEQIRTDYGKEILWLRSRKGFVRLALETGSPIVPVYVFGETSLYKTFNFAKGFRLWLSKRFRVAAPLFWGRFLATPFSVPLIAVAGEPIAVPPRKKKTTKQGEQEEERVSEEEVDRVHAQYIEALTRLFNTHKKELGYADRELVIL